MPDRFTREHALDYEMAQHILCAKVFGAKPADPEVLLAKARDELNTLRGLVEAMRPVIDECEAEDKLDESCPEIAAAFGTYCEWVEASEVEDA